MEIFKALNIHKKYGNFSALKNVSISVPNGSIYGLLGPNGAGKTTFIRIINRITAPDEGEMFFKDHKFRADDVFSIGYLPEERGLYKKMKVGEQALYLCQLKGVSKNDALKKLKYWFEKFEIQSWWNKKVEELSKGMQQKVQFVITILHEPELLIFDEPFSGFDPINASLLKNEILELKKKGSTIIFSTHDMGSVEELCDEITLINKSETLLQGNIRKIKNTYKSNVFEAELSGNQDKINSLLGNKFELIQQMGKEDHFTARIKVHDGYDSNYLLTSLMTEYRIVSFNEVIPNMNEIFIKVVQNAPNTV